MEGTDAKKSNRQPRYCRQGWTDGHEDVVALAAVYGGRDDWNYLMNHTYIHTNDNSLKLAFPPRIRGYARDRRQAFQRKRNPVAPTFSPNIYKFLRGNNVIELLRERANSTMVIPPTSRRPTNNTSAGDVSIDASFDNADAEAVLALVTGMSGVSLTPPRKAYTPQQRQKLWQQFVKEGVKAGFFLLRETYDQQMNFGFQVSVGPSTYSDSGDLSMPWYHIKYECRSLKDFEALKLELSFAHAHPELSPAGTSPVVKFTRQALSNADIADQPRYDARCFANDAMANKNNKKFKPCQERNVKQQNKLVEVNNGLRPTETLALTTSHFILSIDKLTGCPHQASNTEWQGKLFSNKPKKPSELKKNYVPVPYDNEDTACGKKSGAGKRHYAYWEFPVLGPTDRMIGEVTKETDYSEAELEAMTEKNMQGN